MLPEIRSATDKFFCHFGPFFDPLFPQQFGKSTFWKKSTWRYLSKFFISFEQLPSFFEFSDELIWFLSQNLINWYQVHNLLQNTRFLFSDDYTWYYNTAFGNFYFDHVLNLFTNFKLFHVVCNIVPANAWHNNVKPFSNSSSDEMTNIFYGGSWIVSCLQVEKIFSKNAQQPVTYLTNNQDHICWARFKWTSEFGFYFIIRQTKSLFYLSAFYLYFFTNSYSIFIWLVIAKSFNWWCKFTVCGASLDLLIFTKL